MKLINLKLLGVAITSRFTAISVISARTNLIVATQKISNGTDLNYSFSHENN